MGERRKLQGEIDRVLKRVSDGVDTFEDIWEKVQNSSSQNQKEKHEQELKKEIKKLQRLRDQIKTWLTSNDIKDKSALIEARRKIENLMERFKIVERETKTKAYSKEGLGALQKLDPQQKEKDNAIMWITQGIEALNLQTDTAEAESESIMAISKKKRDDKERAARLETLQNRIDRNKYHISSLEKILRLVDNDAIDLKQVQNLKDDVDYYIESNQDIDFAENDGMYDDICFDDVPVIVRNTDEHQHNRLGSESEDPAIRPAPVNHNVAGSIVTSINNSKASTTRQAIRAGSHSFGNDGVFTGRISHAVTLLCLIDGLSNGCLYTFDNCFTCCFDLTPSDYSKVK
ncbi:hypothetical protein GJ496_005476 [Pomphorhynchus laevis]|nr:hypothetical protein GJ496_005476 [Pomphorhynchus laevis]